MRGRKKEPEGKRVTISTKVSEADAAFIDAVRGDISRSEWLRRLLRAGIRETVDAVRSMDAMEPYTPEQLQALHDKIAAEDAEDALS